MKSRTAPPLPSSPQPSLKQVEAAARIVRQFHAAGQKSRDMRPGHAKYRSRRADTPERRSQAERERQSRRVARAYKTRLEALLTKARKHSFPITLAHIIRLARVTPASLRRHIENAMIRSRMSRRELEQEIRFRCGKRGHGHSRKRIGSKASATYAILQFCTAFESLLAGLEKESGKPRQETWWDQLTGPVREQLTMIRQAVLKLQGQLKLRGAGKAKSRGRRPKVKAK